MSQTRLAYKKFKLAPSFSCLLACLILLGNSSAGWTQVEEQKAVKDMSALNSFGFIKPNDKLLSQKWYVLDLKARKLLQNGRIMEAERVWKEAASQAESTTNYDPGLVNCLIGLSLLYHKKGDQKESERVYEYAMRTMEGLGGRESLKFAKYLPDLAWLYHDHGRKDQADILFKKHLELHETEYGKYSTKLLDSIDHYAKFLRKSGRPAEASVMETRAVTIKDKAKP